MITNESRASYNGVYSPSTRLGDIGRQCAVNAFNTVMTRSSRILSIVSPSSQALRSLSSSLRSNNNKKRLMEGFHYDPMEEERQRNKKKVKTDANTSNEQEIGIECPIESDTTTSGKLSIESESIEHISVEFIKPNQQSTLSETDQITKNQELLLSGCKETKTSPMKRLKTRSASISSPKGVINVNTVSYFVKTDNSKERRKLPRGALKIPEPKSKKSQSNEKLIGKGTFPCPQLLDKENMNQNLSIEENLSVTKNQSLESSESINSIPNDMEAYEATLQASFTRHLIGQDSNHVAYGNVIVNKECLSSYRRKQNIGTKRNSVS